jgi:hypothetical protein
VSTEVSPADRLEAARTRCGVTDRSDLARLVATGPDILDLLHRLSTGDVKGLQPGEATVLTARAHRRRGSSTASAPALLSPGAAAPASSRI